MEACPEKQECDGLETSDESWPVPDYNAFCSPSFPNRTFRIFRFSPFVRNA